MVVNYVYAELDGKGCSSRPAGKWLLQPDAALPLWAPLVLSRRRRAPRPGPSARTNVPVWPEMELQCSLRRS